MKPIYYLLLVFPLFITSCSRDEDEDLITQSNYEFTFIDYEEPIEIVQLEILDNNNNIIKTETFYNIQQNTTLKYNFTQGSKLTIKVGDENYFHAFYLIKKNGVIIHGDNSPINGQYYTQFTKQL